MYNQIEAVLSQYEMEIYEVTKGRGTYICDTSKGKKLLVPFRGSGEKAEFLRRFLAELEQQNFFVEQIEVNQNMKSATEDEVTGERFILKSDIEGAEINTNDVEDMKAAVILLAIYHNEAERIVLEMPENVAVGANNIVEIRRRHDRELVKVRNFIRSKKNKNEFELIYMNNYQLMLKTAQQSIDMLEEEEKNNPQCIICHGDYNQHNILWVNGRCQMVNFENFVYGWPMLDLSNYIRKMLEKNDWDQKLGIELIQSYGKYRALDQKSYRQLYGLLLFPEKFWKITNHYMNSRKTWISERDIDKLKKVIDQEAKRLNFIQNLSLYIA